MSIEISPKSFFEQPSVADMRLIACPGAEELTGLIDKHLVRWAKAAGIEKDTFIISCDCPRFQSGDAKGDKQPAKTEQHNNNAPLRTIKHK